MSNGWHHGRIPATSNASGVTYWWHITWRTQRHECHGQVWGTADGREPPVWVDGSYGELRGDTVQCGNCGDLREFDFTAKLCTEDDDCRLCEISLDHNYR